jgi:hypothetical protein
MADPERGTHSSMFWGIKDPIRFGVDRLGESDQETGGKAYDG